MNEFISHLIINGLSLDSRGVSTVTILSIISVIEHSINKQNHVFFLLYLTLALEQFLFIISLNLKTPSPCYCGYVFQYSNESFNRWTRKRNFVRVVEEIWTENSLNIEQHIKPINSMRILFSFSIYQCHYFSILIASVSWNLSVFGFVLCVFTFFFRKSNETHSRLRFKIIRKNPRMR